MRIQIVRFSTDTDSATEVRSDLTGVFAALDEASARRVSYTAYVDESGTDFILVLELDDAQANPLLTLPEAARLRETIGQAADGPVAPATFTIAGSYRS